MPNDAIRDLRAALEHSHPQIQLSVPADEPQRQLLVNDTRNIAKHGELTPAATPYRLTRRTRRAFFRSMGPES